MEISPKPWNWGIDFVLPRPQETGRPLDENNKGFLLLVNPALVWVTAHPFTNLEFGVEKDEKHGERKKGMRPFSLIIR